MAGRARPQHTPTDSDQWSPAAKRSKLSDEAAAAPASSSSTTTSGTSGTSGGDSGVLATGLTPCLETSEVLAPSSDESFGDEGDEGKRKADETAAATTARPGTSSGLGGGAVTSHVLLKKYELPEGSIMGEHALYGEMALIGDGAYGTVYKARDANNGHVVALKRVRVPVTEDGLPTSTVREIAALKQLERFDHPQIVKLLDVCHGNFKKVATIDGRSGRQDQSLTLWLVFEHVERDLASFMSACQSRQIAPPLVRRMSREILSGVDFLHSHRIVHRDLKPQNLLVTKDGHIKIADFGLAKTYDFEMRLTSVVVTLWYRAPEVLLGCPYATPIDIWSVGCILAELNELKPLFPGTSEGDQLDKIFSIIGSPPKEEWPQNTSLGYSAFPFRKSEPINTVIPNLSDSGCELIKNMLIFNPHKRLTAAHALEHPYFAGK